jgi:hypothetical protein
MPGDAPQTPPPFAETRPTQDIWRVPDIVAMEAVRVSYAKPRERVLGGRTVPVAEAVEVLIQTSEPIPVRALAPALHIGDVVLTESEPAGPLRYRFFGFEPDMLQDGSEVSLGWITAGGGRPKPIALRFGINRTEAR